MNSDSNSYQYSSSGRYRARLVLAGVATISFGSLPWFVTVFKQVPFHPTMLFVLIWGVPSYTTGLVFLNFAFRKSTLYPGKGQLIQKSSLLGWTSQKTFDFDRATLFNSAKYGTNSDELIGVIMLRMGKRRRVLVSQWTCSDIAGLFEWLAKKSGKKCFDLRRPTL